MELEESSIIKLRRLHVLYSIFSGRFVNKVTSIHSFSWSHLSFPMTNITPHHNLIIVLSPYVCISTKDTMNVEFYCANQRPRGPDTLLDIFPEKEIKLGLCVMAMQLMSLIFKVQHFFKFSKSIKSNNLYSPNISTFTMKFVVEIR